MTVRIIALIIIGIAMVSCAPGFNPFIPPDPAQAGCNGGIGTPTCH